MKGNTMVKELQQIDYKKPLGDVLLQLEHVMKLYLKNHPVRNQTCGRVVLVGGGSGSAVAGQALLRVGFSSFTLVANVADTLRDKVTREPVGAGLLKVEYKVPDVVDITKQLLHTMPEEERTELHVLLEQKPYPSMRIGYLVLGALYRVLGDLQVAIDVVNEALGNHYRVLAVTDAVTEVFFRGSGSTEFLDLYSFAQVDPGPPAELRLQPSAQLLPTVREVVESASHIILGPGDLHFSILPHFLVRGFREALEKSKAKLVVVANLTYRSIDTPGFTLRRYLDVYDGYLPTERPVTVLMNQGGGEFESALNDDVYGSEYGRFSIIRSLLASSKINNNNQLVHDTIKLGTELKANVASGLG